MQESDCSPTHIVRQEWTHSTINTDAARSEIYRDRFRSLCYAATNTVKDIDPSDELRSVRVRANDETEVILAPDVDGGLLVVIQSVPPYEPPYRPPKGEISVSPGSDSDAPGKIITPSLSPESYAMDDEQVIV